ncbi:hypothetical protein KFL_007580010, partial [Klebsormidium nitens]
MEDSLGSPKKKRKARLLAGEEGVERRETGQKEKPPSDRDGAEKRKKARKEVTLSEDVTKDRKGEREEKTVSEQDGAKDQKKRKKKKHRTTEEAPQAEDTGKEMELVEAVEPTKKGKHQVETRLEKGDEERRKKKKKKKEKKARTAEEGAIVLTSEEPNDRAPEAARGQSPAKEISDYEGEAIVLSGDRAEHWKDDDVRTDLKYGAFSKEEDEIIRAAVAEYIEERNLGEDGIEKLLNTRKHKEVQGAWLEIARCLPERSVKRVHARACRLLHGGNYKGRWSREEEERLQTLHAQLGPKWVQIGSMMGRLPDACKDKWRIIGVTDKKKGQWSPKESEQLSRLVQESLSQKRIRTSVERVVDGRQVRDDIDWTAISARMGVRTANQCLRHWYDVLAPGMVRTGTGVEEWGGEDDQLMLQRIVESGATSEPEVEWASLLPHRDGTACRKRWRMMIKHLPPSQDFERNLASL